MTTRNRIYTVDNLARRRALDSALLKFAVEKYTPVDKLEPGDPASIARDIEPLIGRLMYVHDRHKDRTGAEGVAMRTRLETAWAALAENLEQLEVEVLAAEALERDSAASEAASIQRRAAGAAGAATPSKTKDRGSPVMSAPLTFGKPGQAVKPGDINKANTAFWDSQK